ncbi:E3 ubiquitin-protein ligase Siah2 isoform X2 [Narcine bancroftii]|uniref:E3 ubiquitin-protein ligase Siah2 isoform X2 n=1 Tax=Narcine bancroftii TaxID=1343680 RepID=UPI0038312EBF
MSRPSSAGGGKTGKHTAAAVAAAAGAGGGGGGGGGGNSAITAAAATAAGGSSPPQPELTSLFECPVCFDYVLPPILQCQAGHLVCNQCRQKLSCCPTCRGPLSPSIRNLAMEKVASTIPFPCKMLFRIANLPDSCLIMASLTFIGTTLVLVLEDGSYKDDQKQRSKPSSRIPAPMKQVNMHEYSQTPVKLNVPNIMVP